MADYKKRFEDWQRAAQDKFEEIDKQFGLKEKDVIELMRTQMKRSSYLMWRKRMHGKATKHQKLRDNEAIKRFKCTQQKTISMNKMSKR